MSTDKPEKTGDKKIYWDFFWAFFMPTIVGKIFIMQFGSMYSAEPGAGWGWWLAGAIGFTVFMLGRFLWKYRNYKD